MAVPSVISAAVHCLTSLSVFSYESAFPSLFSCLANFGWTVAAASAEVESGIVMEHLQQHQKPSLHPFQSLQCTFRCCFHEL